jgi:hypothetical protein
MPRGSAKDSLGDRIIVALVSAITAAITLAIYSVVLIILTRGHGASGGRFRFAETYHALVFSKTGFAIICGTAVVGFLVGAERVANIFSFFWGTHSFWSRAENQVENWFIHGNGSWWLFLVLLAILLIILARHYVSP